MSDDISPVGSQNSPLDRRTLLMTKSPKTCIWHHCKKNKRESWYDIHFV